MRSVIHIINKVNSILGVHWIMNNIDLKEKFNLNSRPDLLCRLHFLCAATKFNVAAGPVIC